MRDLAMGVIFVLMLLTLMAEPIWAADGHIILVPDTIKWGPAPPGLPPATQSAVVFGNPEKDGPFVIRVKAPARLV